MLFPNWISIFGSKRPRNPSAKGIIAACLSTMCLGATRSLPAGLHEQTPTSIKGTGERGEEEEAKEYQTI